MRSRIASTLRLLIAEQEPMSNTMMAEILGELNTTLVKRTKTLVDEGLLIRELVYTPDPAKRYMTYHHTVTPAGIKALEEYEERRRKRPSKAKLRPNEVVRVPKNKKGLVPNSIFDLARTL